ncbi:Tyrosine-protein kinase Srms [Heterocephalus glaber]|uniref:Tyrosine-protein kinase Srms n=1 Tax=Heterocephalus glaber TaxID=10181 RepID=G5C8D0_HETGA|nr:Tyrosine-protein kinase Srms [Heterocephalus glaber]
MTARPGVVFLDGYLAQAKKPPAQDKWERPRSEFVLWRKLGEGCFGEVWEGLWLGSVPLVVNVIKPGEAVLPQVPQPGLGQCPLPSDPGDARGRGSGGLGSPGAEASPAADMKLAEFTKEIAALKSLRHERLMWLHVVCSTGEPVYIITEVLCKGSLQAYLGTARLSPGGQQPSSGPGGVSGPVDVTCGLHCSYSPLPGLQPTRAGIWGVGTGPGLCYSQPGSRAGGESRPRGPALSLPLLLSFTCQVAEAMSYLEEWHIVHRDLAARNVLVGNDLTFGLARLLKDDIYSPSSSSKIPVKWTAPEAANYHIFSHKSDVWSFGILLYEVFTYGQCPFEVEVYLLLLECWKGSPEERPAFAMLREKLGTVHRHLHLGLT